MSNIFGGLFRLNTQMPVCHHPSLFTRRENICSNMSSANRLPSVPACNSHHSRPVSPEHAGMVTDEKIESEGLAWLRTRQDDQAGQFVSPGRDHSRVCINFCIHLFLKLVPSFALNLSRAFKYPVFWLRAVLKYTNSSFQPHQICFSCLINLSVYSRCRGLFHLEGFD